MQKYFFFFLLYATIITTKKGKLYIEGAYNNIGVVKWGNLMERLKEMSFKEMMQLSHDLEEMEQEFDFINSFVNLEKIKTVKKE